jgi:hypothetical protein
LPEFDRLTRVDFIIVFVINFFFQCKPLILDWFEIEFYNFFFWFSFYEFIMVLWFGSRVRPIDLRFFFLIFFNFIIQYWVDWELSFIIYFGLCSMRLSWFYDLDHEFGRLTRMFFYVFFLIDFFLFHPSTLGWLQIELRNLFRFAFYVIILILWPKFDKLA